MENAADEPTVLVVDDDPDVRELVVDTLEEGGFVSAVASTSEEAIILLKDGNFRVLILDVGFGSDHVKGWAVARRARAYSPSLPVIYITGGSSDDWSIEGVPNSVLLSKPFAPAQLLTAIAQLLNVRSVD
jgi:DNA-binding response OmpR family regulator